MWTAHGWKHVTPSTSPGKYGQYICELCGQEAIFAEGPVQKAHFRHMRGTDDNNCPERLTGPYDRVKPKKYSLPIRLVLNKKNNAVRFELGMTYVPKAVLAHHSSRSITITRDDGKTFTYRISERINETGITYLDVGDYPSRHYYIDSPDELAFFWPGKVEGINHYGTLFNTHTCRMLPVDADVQAGENYYLLTNKTLPSHNDVDVINRDIVCDDCNMYQVGARTLSRDTAKFFLHFGYWLNDAPVKINVLWPVHIEIPYTAIHDNDEVIVHVDGLRETRISAYPYTKIEAAKNHEGGKLLRMSVGERHKLISESSSCAVNYMYLCREELKRTLSRSEIEGGIDIRDSKDNHISQGRHTRLPAGGFLTVTAPFDGYVIVRINGVVVSRQKVDAGKFCRVSGLRYGHEVSVLQGLDRVFTASFMREKETANDDDTLFTVLNRCRNNFVSVPHWIGGVAERLSGMPKVREWLRMTARRGIIPEQALKIIRKYIADGGVKNGSLYAES